MLITGARMLLVDNSIKIQNPENTTAFAASTVAENDEVKCRISGSVCYRCRAG